MKIVSTNVALTAAHVVIENGAVISPNRLYVSAGRDDLTKGELR